MEAKILIRTLPNGTKEVSTYDPQREREDRTGLIAHSEEELEKIVSHIKTQIERAGAHVEVKEM
jgi:hypothetical protein